MSHNTDDSIADEIRLLLGKLSTTLRHHQREIKNLEATIAEAEKALLRLNITSDSSSPHINVTNSTTQTKSTFKPSAPKKLPPDITHIDTFVTKYIHHTNGFELYESEIRYYDMERIQDIPKIGSTVMIYNQYKSKDGLQQYKHLGLITGYISRDKSQVHVRIGTNREYRKHLSSLRVITRNHFKIPQRFIDAVV